MVKLKKYAGQQKREHYRVEYPTSYRPVLTTDEENYEVLEISERGLKFRHTFLHEALFSVNEKIEGELVFRDKRSIAVDGTIFRKLGKSTVILVETAIPLSVIRSEDLYVVKNFIQNSTADVS